mmetsp:Transcript_4758/g.13551  ORF Transcript_4758/g.13551 Transcript_4758/m.13551 type:complete len:222 (-) Transcript_4758:119-784(-)
MAHGRRTPEHLVDAAHTAAQRPVRAGSPRRRARGALRPFRRVAAATVAAVDNDGIAAAYEAQLPRAAVSVVACCGGEVPGVVLATAVKRNAVCAAAVAFRNVVDAHLPGCILAAGVASQIQAVVEVHAERQTVCARAHGRLGHLEAAVGRLRHGEGEARSPAPLEQQPQLHAPVQRGQHHGLAAAPRRLLRRHGGGARIPRPGPGPCPGPERRSLETEAPA